MRTPEALAEHVRSLALDIGVDPVLEGADGPLGRPVEVHGRRIGNRFAIHPMEGWDGTPEGLPSELTLRRWRRFGESGAKLIWGGEAFAVRADGRANPNQLFLNDGADVESGLRELLAEIRRGHAAAGLDGDDLLIGLQLTHSGRYARPDADGPRPLIVQHHPVLDRRLGLRDDHPLLTDDELEAIGDRYVLAAAAAQRAGFDFVDVKCCHGYLMHELLGARTRPGRFGGPFEHRTALLRRIVDGIRSACPGLIVAVRLSVTDAPPFAAADGVGAPEPGPEGPYRWGFGVDADDPIRPDLDEPRRLLELLHDLGVRLLNVTLGSPYYCPHLQRPAAYPPSDGYRPPEDPLRGVALHLGMTAACKLAQPEMVVVGTGYSYLQEHLPHVAQAEVRAGRVDLVGLGRMALSYPGLPRDVLAGRPLRRNLICRTFSDCTTAPRNGLVSGCYPLDPHYKTMPQAVELRAIKKRTRGGAS
jgi:2,4-dienoyl-CoA reductase-like NADH-dependent reductase (Old Yellow Enzyme family)